MSAATQPQRQGPQLRELIVTYEFEVEPELGLMWLSELIARPANGITPRAYLAMMAAFRDLKSSCPDGAGGRLPPQLPARGRALLQTAEREARQRDPNWVE